MRIQRLFSTMIGLAVHARDRARVNIVNTVDDATQLIAALPEPVAHRGRRGGGPPEYDENGETIYPEGARVLFDASQNRR